MEERYTAPYLSAQPDGAMIRFKCSRCGRRGQYRKETLLARFGDVCMPDLLAEVADCERSKNYGKPCGVCFDSDGPDHAREAAAMVTRTGWQRDDR